MRRLGSNNEGWLVAVSGGPDSFALLDLAFRSTQRTPRSLQAITVQHHLRPEAEDELRTVQRWCNEREVPHLRHDLASPPTPAAARRARYGALRTAALQHGLPSILLGHHADDQVESILLALVRGAGPRGLAGMKDRRSLGQGVQILRPFLETPGHALRSHAEEQNLPFHDEPGNLDPKNARGRIRTVIRPELEALRDGCGMAMVNNGALMRAADRALHARANHLANNTDRKIWSAASEGLRLAALGLRAPNTTNVQLRPLCLAIADEEKRPRIFAVHGGVMELTSRELVGPKVI